MPLRAASAALLSAGALLLGPVLAAPAQASTIEPAGDGSCLTAGTSARGLHGRGADTRDVSAAEQTRITREATARLAERGLSRSAAAATGGNVPVYVHVMAAKNGAGNVTSSQITRQIAVLNNTYAGGESTAAANTGFTFTLAGTNRFFNDTWHQDRQSATYRAQTRRGGANALNIWIVDFAPTLGIATFPWDYASNPTIDGIRVQYSSLPGGSATNFNLGKTATHEAGHWLGLYHTFQGGCTTRNDQVSDTPAQSSPTSGCPVGRDSCSLPGLDPIRNYMDYSFDTCYRMFTSGQSARMSQMFAAYRG
ncbi:MAG TPA: zinc metalloprotease [Marmoricola sp.]|nr:zinc metalloprotease [Marmoricola sp.]